MKKNIAQVFDITLAKNIVSSAKKNNMKVRLKPSIKKREGTK